MLLFYFLLFQDLNYLHNDLKAANVMLVDSYDATTIKIIDLGLCTNMTNRMPFKPKSTYQDLFYRAPEHFFLATCGYKTEVWSIGLFLLEIMLKDFIFKDGNESHSVYIVSNFLVFPVVLQLILINYL